jgi:pilus assembly protein CpaE
MSAAISNPVRILVVDDDRTMCELLRLVLSKDGHEVIITASAEEALVQVNQHAPQIVITDVVLPQMDGMALCRKLRERPETSHIPIIIMTTKDETKDKVAGFEAGADDYLVKPFDPEELKYRVRNLLGRKTSAPAEPKTSARAPGKTIVFFGSKGGVGKTSIALNLALTMQRKATLKKVALFDADFAFGDIAARLNLPTTRSILDLARNADSLDVELVQQVMVAHSSGLRVLLNPVHPVEAELITPEQVKKIMRLITTMFDLVIVDCQSSYDERTLALLDNADMLMLVVTPEIGPIKNARQFLEIAEDLGIPSDKIFIVLNRFNSNVGIEREEIERTYKRKIAFLLASAGRTITLCTNQGTPLVIAQPNHPFSQQIAQMAEHLTKQLTQG